MTNDIVFSGGGSIAVATGEIVRLITTLDDVADECADLALLFGTIDALASDELLAAAGAPYTAYDGQAELSTAARELGACAMKVTLIVLALRASTLAYGLTEDVLERSMTALTDRLGYTVGFFLPVVTAFALPFAVSAAVPLVAGTAIASAFMGPEAVAAAWAEIGKRVLSNPVTVNIFRTISTAIDDAQAGVLKLPPGVAALIGDSGLGLTGVDTAASAITALTTGVGLFRKTDVTVKRTGKTRLDGPPTTFEERLKRIPQADSNGGSQIRVDRYKIPGGPDRFEVYLSGTQEWMPAGTTTPFDLGSNVRGVAEWPNGALDAVKQALKDAEVNPKSPVTFIGHSQGGLLAHQLAASGEFNTVAVLEAGPPASQSKLPPGVDQVILAHDGDIVTGLGGDYPGSDAIIVRRDPDYDTLPSEIGDQAVPMHARELYQETAAMVDQAPNEKTAHIRDRMNEMSDGATKMTSKLYKASRP